MHPPLGVLWGDGSFSPAEKIPRFGLSPGTHAHSISRFVTIDRG
jgi:hypothetical protein